MYTQVTDWQDNARGIIQIKISPLILQAPSSPPVPVWPLESWTSDDLEDERDMISKIRARQYLRLDLLYNFAQSGERRGAKARAGACPRIKTQGGERRGWENFPVGPSTKVARNPMCGLWSVPPPCAAPHASMAA